MWQDNPCPSLVSQGNFLLQNGICSMILLNFCSESLVNLRAFLQVFILLSHLLCSNVPGEIQLVTKSHGLSETKGDPFQCNSVSFLVNFHR